MIEPKVGGPEERILKPSGYVGFDNLPWQFVNKQLANGYILNILCVGETGLGKSTLIETLFKQKFDFTPSTNDHPQVKLKSSTFDLQSGTVNLKLNITETSGFGDQLSKEDSATAILDYINQQYESYLQEEIKAKRSLPTYNDTRIHACLYFISPSGHSLKSLDLVTMKKLNGVVNILPLIAKADTITKSELQKFKTRILSDMESNGVHPYQFSTDDEFVREQNVKLNSLIPFAIVGGTDPVTLPGGRRGRGRQYPWGAVCVDYDSHCDTGPLGSALLLLNTEHLRQVTCTEHYERYRRGRLLELGFSDEDRLSVPEMFARQRESQTAALRGAEEAARQLLVRRAAEADARLQREEAELRAAFDAQKRHCEEKARRLDEQRRQLDAEEARLRQRQQQWAAASAAAAYSNGAGGSASLNRPRRK